MVQNLIQHFSGELLQEIDKADDLKIAPLRSDAVTYGTPTWIWSVVVGKNLYVRAYNGKRSRWYQAAIIQQYGRIYTAGMTIEVKFEIVEENKIISDINSAYKEKYKNSPYLPPMLSKQTSDATIMILPKLKPSISI